MKQDSNITAHEPRFFAPVAATMRRNRSRHGSRKRALLAQSMPRSIYTLKKLLKEHPYHKFANLPAVLAHVPCFKRVSANGFRTPPK